MADQIVNGVDTIAIFDPLGLDKGWHGKGTPVKDRLSNVPEILAATGLDRRVIQSRLSAVDDGSLEVENLLNYYPADDKRAAVSLGVVGEGYKVCQNSECVATAWDLAHLGESDIQPYMDTGGSLFGGRLSFVSIGGSEFSVARNDKDIVRPLFGMWWGHDGKTGLTGAAFTTRIVCNNTRRAALREGKESGALWSVKHTKDMESRIEAVKEAMQNWKSGIKEFQNQAETLAGVQCNKDNLSEFFTRVYNRVWGVIPADSQKDSKSERDRAYAGSVLTKMKELTDLEFERTGEVTLWNAANAATEYLQKFDKGRRARSDAEVGDRRALSDLNGKIADNKILVFKEALAMV